MAMLPSSELTRGQKPKETEIPCDSRSLRHPRTVQRRALYAEDHGKLSLNAPLVPVSDTIREPTS